jgi:hypothetical protein
MRSLGVRIARGMNRLMERQGRVVAHRYHARPLRTPSEVRRARHYVLNNDQKHARESGRTATNFVDSYSSDAVGDLPSPRTWLLRIGWKRTAQ